MPFDFDAYVRAMRATGEQPMIAELYRQLFALERWFFLEDAARNAQPVLWQFEDGRNASPCILAFTDEFKAAACARALDGRRLPLLKPAPRKGAVEWMLELPAPISWACFNFEGPRALQSPTVNFPLYFDDARRFHELA
jgi:hypothetical protein